MIYNSEWVGLYCSPAFWGGGGRVRLFLGDSGYFWESQAIFGRVRLFLGESGYFWEIQVIFGRFRLLLGVCTMVSLWRHMYNPLTHMLEVGC